MKGSEPRNTQRSFGDRLREVRVNQNLSQTELAGKIGRKQTDLSNWECGRSEPDLNTVKALAAALECDLVELIGTITKRKGGLRDGFP